MFKKIHHEISKFMIGYSRISGKTGHAVFIHDTSGNIFGANRAAEKLTGYSNHELLKMNVKQLHPKRQVALSTKKLRVIDKLKRRVDFNAEFLKKDKMPIKVKIEADRFKFKGKNFVIGTVTKIIKKKRYAISKRTVRAVPDKRTLSRLHKLNREYIESLRVLIDVAEAKDPYTMRHSAKVSDYAVGLATYLRLPIEYIEEIKLAAMLHDIGKIGIKKSILLKPSGLSKKEYEEVKRHPELSVDIVKPLHFSNGLLPIIKHHHENYDGTGYPDGLSGEDIPLGARILSIVDVYDALTSKRAYRKAFSHKKAVNIMKNESRKEFDMFIVETFMDYIKKEKKRQNEYKKDKPER